MESIFENMKRYGGVHEDFMKLWSSNQIQLILGKLASFQILMEEYNMQDEHYCPNNLHYADKTKSEVKNMAYH